MARKKIIAGNWKMNMTPTFGTGGCPSDLRGL